MSEATTQLEPFTFDKLADLFVEARSMTPPSQLHGMLCGQFCAGMRPDHKGWLDAATEQMALSGEMSVTVRAGLVDFYDVVLGDLSASDLSFALLLPENEETIGQRTEALGQWCSGFISGFGASSITKTQLSEEAAGVLTDLAQISQVQAEDMEESEDAEKDFFEVCEYARMAALMLFNESQDQRASKAKTANNPFDSSQKNSDVIH
ncbi:UPF0149 family protein [Sansalvadorimonas verongulae]|uniref:UPF0149 family protein n=1 Tax=Sansalvadorimonas verongulae TaxID=2172824 RepID=UPI0012BCB2A5|nr:UPF0149 family protein [Sansalvadorimonas verongulae]MTI13304.1 hypothetical protein [Sansalvadorimonas verongulae]